MAKEGACPQELKPAYLLLSQCQYGMLKQLGKAGQPDMWESNQEYFAALLDNLRELYGDGDARSNLELTSGKYSTLCEGMN